MVDSQTKTSHVVRLQSAAALAGALTTAIGLLVLSGWLLDQPRLTNFNQGFATMKPNAAVAFVFGGVSLFLISKDSNPLAKRLAFFFAVAVTLIAVATLSEYLFGRDLYIDQLLFQMKGTDALAANPGRMSAATGVKFLIVGVGLILLMYRQTVAAAQVCALVALLIALLALAGYLYNARSLYSFGAFATVALPTVLSFILLGIGVMGARAGQGLMTVIASESAGGVMARQLVPAAVVAPLILGSIRLAGQNAGYYDTAMGLALFALSNIVVFLGLIFWSAQALHSPDSERVKKAEALRETQSRLKSALSAGFIGTWMWDLSTEVVAADGFTAHAFSMDPVLAEKGIEVHLWIERIHPDDRPAVQAALGKAIESCGQYDVEYRVVADDGGYRWLQARGRVEGENGQARHFHGAVMDITDRRFVEEEVRTAKQRLEETLAELQRRNDELAVMSQQLWQASSLATMGELAASIAHELNNPLATMALRAELLANQIPENDLNRQGVTVISNEIDRMARLVDSLVQSSRPSRSQISSLDIREEIENALELIDYHFRSRGIEIATDFSSNLPYVQGDRQRLRQVFLNLLTNAGDSMPNGGTLTMRTAVEKSGEGETFVCIEVVDTGMGIAPDNLKKVFDPFFTTKPQGKGTGLGLPICRRAIDQHGGTILIESELSRGTSIKINLPTIPLLLAI